MNPIPKIFHFVFGLKPQTEPFHIVYYLCLRSCIEVNNPDKVLFHYHYEPHGEWWDKIKPELELVHVELESHITETDAYNKHAEGQFIKQHKLNYAHQADFIRLRALIKHGGVYADMDTLFVRTMPNSFYQHQFAIGTEGKLEDEQGNFYQSLCNALMLAQPNAIFAKEWLAKMHDTFDGTWSKHSCALASQLAATHKNNVTILPKNYFYKFDFTTSGINSLLENFTTDLKGIYSIHLWNHLWWEKDRTDFSLFHHGLLTEQSILKGGTTYTALARTFLI